MPTTTTKRFTALGIAPLLATLAGCSSPTAEQEAPAGCYDSTHQWYYADCSNLVNPMYVGSVMTNASGTVAPPPPSGIASVAPSSGNMSPTTSTGVPAPSATVSGVVPPPASASVSGAVVPPMPTTTDGTVVPMPSVVGTDVPPVATEMPPPMTVVTRAVCTNVAAGLISDFEEGPVTECPEDGACTDAGNVIGQEGWNAKNRWAAFYDKTGTKPTATVETDGATECNNKVLHVVGGGHTDWGAGVGVSLIQENKGTYAVSDEYDATAKFNAIRFRAKSGSANMTPVRFNFSIPRTEGKGDGGQCDTGVTGHQCYNHNGKFLDQEFALTTSWQDYTLCLDRDFYPLFLMAESGPEELSLEERKTFASHILKLQFQFNKQFDHTTTEEFDHATPYDFYLDDVGFVTADCETAPMHAKFQSEASTANKFPQNATLGTCAAATDAAKFNSAISYAYTRWKANFLRNDGGVVSPEQDNKVTSEGISYGMMIAASMGDKAAFDAIWGWGNSHKDAQGLVHWDNGSGNSATDADLDIAYALLMADKQWGGYKTTAQGMASAARMHDVSGNLLKGGDMYDNVFNPSYFAPANMRAFDRAGFGQDWGSLISPNYSKITGGDCDGGFSPVDGIVPDWCGSSNGAQVTSNVCGTGACSGYDAARVPYRIGFDVCSGGTEGTSFINMLINTYKGKAGSSIAFLKAGFDSSGNNVEDKSVPNELAFIGTVGVGAMGAGDTTVRDQAFRAALDIIERPEYNHTYYSTSLGMITLLMMSGNWPTP